MTSCSTACNSLNSTSGSSAGGGGGVGSRGYTLDGLGEASSTNRPVSTRQLLDSGVDHEQACFLSVILKPPLGWSCW